MAPFILPSMRGSRPVPLAEKHPLSIMFPPPCLTVGMVFLGLSSVFLFLQHSESSWCQRARFWSNLTRSPSLNPSGVHWQTSDMPVHVYSSAGGPCGHCRILIDGHFVFLPFPNNLTNSCLLLSKLLADGLVAHSSLVQVYHLVPDVLRRLFGLAHGGEVGIWLIDSVDRCLLYR